MVLLRPIAFAGDTFRAQQMQQPQQLFAVSFLLNSLFKQALLYVCMLVSNGTVSIAFVSYRVVLKRGVVYIVLLQPIAFAGDTFCAQQMQQMQHLFAEILFYSLF